VDRVENRSLITSVLSRFGNAVCISAERGINMNGLVSAVAELLEGTIVEETIRFKQDDYELMSQVHDEGEVLEKRYDGTSVFVRFRMDRARAERIKDALARKRSRRRH
jgi:50S ribosomal subunit-associated GTPase HflX